MTVKIPFMVNENVSSSKLSNIDVYAPDFSAIAKGMGALGDASEEYFGRLQDERNVATAKEIDAKLSMAVDFRSSEAQAKLGKESIGVTKSSAEELDIDIASIGEDYKDNSFAQKYLSNQGKGAKAHLFGTTVKHETNQVMVQSQQASEQQVSVETSRIVNDSLSSGSFAEGYGRNYDSMRKATLEFARVKGVDPNTALSAVTGDMITTFAVSAEPEAVLEALELPSVKGVVDEKIRQTLKEKALDDKNYLDATNMGGELYLSGASESDVLRQAREKFPKDPRAQSVVMGGFAQAVSAQRRVTAEADMGMREGINTKISNGEPLNPTEDAWYRKETGKDPNKQQDVEPTVQDYTNLTQAQVRLTRKLSTAKSDSQRTIALNDYQSEVGKSINPALHRSAYQQGAQILEASKNPKSNVQFAETTNRVVSQLNAQGFGLGTDKEKVNAQADIITIMLNQRTDGYLPDGSPNPVAVMQAYGTVKDVKKGQAPERLKYEVEKNDRDFKYMSMLGVDMSGSRYEVTPLQKWLDADNGVKNKERKVMDASDTLQRVFGRQPTPSEVTQYLLRLEKQTKAKK